MVILIIVIIVDMRQMLSSFAYIFLSESRYLLILTENYAALDLLQQQLTTLKDAISIFGSSFKNDQEYTQVKSRWKMKQKNSNQILWCSINIYFPKTHLF